MLGSLLIEFEAGSPVFSSLTRNTGNRAFTSGTHAYRFSSDTTGVVVRSLARLSNTTPMPRGAITGWSDLGFTLPPAAPVWVTFHDTSVTTGPTGAGTRESQTKTSSTPLVSVTVPAANCTGSLTSVSAGDFDTNATTAPSLLTDTCSAPNVPPGVGAESLPSLL